MWQKVAKFKGAEYFRKALYPLPGVNIDTYPLPGVNIDTYPLPGVNIDTYPLLGWLLTSPGALNFFIIAQIVEMGIFNRLDIFS